MRGEGREWKEGALDCNTDVPHGTVEQVRSDLASIIYWLCYSVQVI